MSLPEITASTANPAELGVDVLVVGLASNGEGSQIAASGLTAELADALLDAATAVGADSDRNSTCRIPAPPGFACTSIVLTGLGAGTPSANDLREVAGYAAQNIQKVSRVAYALPTTTSDDVLAVAEGALIGSHRIQRTQVLGEAAASLQAITVFGQASPTDLNLARIRAEAIWRVRDLVALPPNVLQPQSFVERVSAMASSLDISIEVLDEAALRDQGYGGLTAVGQGSTNPPRMMILRWSPPSATRHIALVGKGITFDSGGLSLKPANSMVGMKYDMTGAAVVSAVVLASAASATSTAVTAWVCLAENMPSGSASRPNDVITIKNGTTVEILNTDAEGRLVLADGLSAASVENPDLIIDVATLTGAARVALGERYAGLMGSEGAVSEVQEAAKNAGELVWPMPLPEELRSLLKTDVADIANAKPGNTLGGMLVAGLFLREFIGVDSDGNRLPWAHLDIAGPAENSSGPWGYTPKGPTGALTRTLLEIVGAKPPVTK
jgi:leucyl aminopeptidase